MRPHPLIGKRVKYTTQRGSGVSSTEYEDQGIIYDVRPCEGRFSFLILKEDNTFDTIYTKTHLAKQITLLNTPSQEEIDRFQLMDMEKTDD